MKTISSDRFEQILLQKTPIIDVRAPIEFESGSLPYSMNLPILDNLERQKIGTIYKQQGREKAIEVGHEIVSGQNRDIKMKKWVEYIQLNPQAIVTCFRGGLRSQLTQKWLHQEGLEIPRLEKGYKEFRSWIIDYLKTYFQNNPFIVLSGPTGSGKTELIEKIKTHYPALNLEKCANHKGSAFGAELSAQPTQVDFENRICSELVQINKKFQEKPILIEDESRTIGSVHLTDELFTNLRAQKVIFINEPLEYRVQRILDEYVLQRKDLLASGSLIPMYIKNIQKIEKRLGHQRSLELQKDIESAGQNILQHAVWIEKLLKYYYDPIYGSSLERRRVEFLMKGSHSEIQDFLLSKTF